jgi:hypothetical protein
MLLIGIVPVYKVYSIALNQNILVAVTDSGFVQLDYSTGNTVNSFEGIVHMAFTLRSSSVD